MVEYSYKSYQKIDYNETDTYYKRQHKVVVAVWISVNYTLRCNLTVRV